MAALGQLRAMQEATQLLTYLKIDRSRPVDPFAALDKLNVEVRFDVWRELLGALLPTDPAHVLINKAMPGSVQRFTAAHELGHYLLHADTPAIDLEIQIDGVQHVEREREAQAFAATFLMPLDLLYETASRYDVEQGQPIHPDQIYAMARDMHVSYAAAVHQLANTNFIRSSQRPSYLKTKPAVLKRDLTNGGDLANPRGDVWLFDGAHGDLDVEVFVGDEIVVTLPENPSTGYTWNPATSGWTWEELSNPAVTDGNDDESEPSVQIVQDGFEPAPPDEVRVGAGGVRRIGISTVVPGRFRVNMRNARPFAPDDAPMEQGLLANVRADPQGEMKERYLDDFRGHEREVTYLDRPGDDG